jgi:hypothetical protein
MNPYMAIASSVGTPSSRSLAQRLIEWHDAMVAHERSARGARIDCDADCPHVEAQQLWPEAAAMFGKQAPELSFLRSRATVARKAA